MSIETERLETLSDLFEEITGERVDLAAWDLAQLVRLLRHPNEVAGLCGVFESEGYTSAGRFIARDKVIGPRPSRQREKSASFGERYGRNTFAQSLDEMQRALDQIHENGRLCPATLNLAPGAVVTCTRCRRILAPHTAGGEIYAPHHTHPARAVGVHPMRITARDLTTR